MTTSPSTLTPPSSSPAPAPAAPPSPANRYRAMVHDLATGAYDLDDLAARHKLTRLQMARWIARPRYSAMLDDLARLADRRATLLLATGRAQAASTLLQLSAGEMSPATELQRKACLDLIKLDRSLPPPRTPGARRPVDDAAPTEQEMRDSMEELARRAAAESEAPMDGPFFEFPTSPASDSDPTHTTSLGAD